MSRICYRTKWQNLDEGYLHFWRYPHKMSISEKTTRNRLVRRSDSSSWYIFTIETTVKPFGLENMIKVLRDLGLWSPHLHDHHISMITTSPWSPHLHDHHISMITISPWSPHLHDHHISMVTISPWSPHLHGHHISMVTISPWSPYLHDLHISMISTSPRSPHLHGHHISMISTSPWSPHHHASLWDIIILNYWFIFLDNLDNFFG